MFYRRILSFAAALVLAVTAGEAVFAKTLTQRNNGDKKNARVSAPLNIAILMQDDLISQVANELNVTRDFIRALPEGSRVMVGYITAGMLTVYTFYAPAVGLTSRSRIAASYGQNSLNRLANETGGKAFFQGTTGFVTFDYYFQRLRQMLNEQYARAY